MAYNTGNPIGSIDPRDAADNKENFDRFALSTARTYTDRLGIQRKTVTGTLQDYAAYNLRGEWTAATAYNVNDVWRDGTAGAFYLVLADYTSGASAAVDIAGGNVVVHQPKDWVVSVATIADLRALEPAFNWQQVSVVNSSNKGVFGSIYFYDSSDTSSIDDGIDVIVTTAGARWKNININYYEQPDFVDILSGHSEFEAMYFKRENSLGWITAMLKRGDKHISWSFRNNVYDDYWILGDCFTGTISIGDVVLSNADYDSTSGTGWVTPVGNAHYTTNTGDTFTTTVTGERIDFNFYADDRGGVWSFVVDGDTGGAVEVSTYRSVASAYTETVFSGLSNTAHTIVGTFIGDDPLNPPSGGTGTSRGWVWVSNSGASTLYTYRTYKAEMVNSRDIELLEGFSNKEFAVSMRPAGTSGAYHFVPMHSSVGTAFSASPLRIVLDGSEVDPFSYTTGFFTQCNSLQVAQSVYGRHPDYPADDLVEINTTVSINKNGVATINGSMTVLEDIDIDAGYFIMCPVDTAATTVALTSLYNEYDTTISDDSKTYLVPERDRVKSVVFTSSVNGDCGVAVSYDSIHETLRQNSDGKWPFNLMCWIEHRSSGIQKLYQSVFNNTTRTAGEKFRFSGRLGGFIVPGINRSFK